MGPKRADNANKGFRLSLATLGIPTEPGISFTFHLLSKALFYRKSAMRWKIRC
jgi:hypothetical protein